MDSDSDSSNSDVDDLIVKRKAGGSIIDQRPLFSNDGETLYLVRKNVVRIYSTQTGDFVQEFEPSDYRIVNILMHPENDHAIIGCTERGQLDVWSYPSSIIIKKLPLKLEDEKAKIKTFHIVKYKISKNKEIHQALITHLSECGNKIYVLLFDIKNGTCAKSTHIFVKSQEYYVDVIGNHEKNLIAVLHDSNLHILNSVRNLVDRLHKTGKTNRLPTCIAGHPVEQCVATGDNTGRVVVWRNLFQTRPYTAVFHWHTLPVREIAFSKSGSHIYTGGGECVLVKWSLANPLRKSFLPRLPAPIKHLTIAPDNLYVAVSTLDNGILIVSPQKKVTAVIQNFTWGVASFCKDLFPAGLVVDPRTDSLVLNSRTGHVQFYNTHTQKLLYNIDITAQNVLTQERDVIIANAEVTKIALNHDGTWMATVEVRKSRPTYIVVRLKFWSFDLNKQTFKLNTSFKWPHGQNSVEALQFQPSSIFDDGELTAVTTGDKIFKLWILEPPTEGKEERHWYFYKKGDYRTLTATDAGFSIDGSLLAVGFDSTMTLWLPDEDFKFKIALTHGFYEHPIKRIEFGKQYEVGHLVVVASAKYIIVWNLLTMRLIWTVPLAVTNLTYDPKSTYMVAFTTDNSLYVFTPQSPDLVYKKSCMIESTSSILGATFVPHLKEVCNPLFGQWQTKSQLYFLDSDQELLTLEPASEMSIPLESSEQVLNKETTPLPDLSVFASSHSSSTKEQDITTDDENLSEVSKILKYMRSFPHYAIPWKDMFMPFMLALSKEKPKSPKRKAEDSSDDEAEDNTSKLNNKEESQPTKPAPPYTPLYNDEDTDEMNTQVETFDWSSLANLFPE